MTPTCDHVVCGRVALLEALHGAHGHLVRFAGDHVGQQRLEHVSVHGDGQGASCGGAEETVGPITEKLTYHHQ